MKKRMMFLVCLFAVSLGGAFSSTEVSAQVKAALTRDMDSPIRGDRYTQVFSGTFPANAFSITSEITPTVPAGKRLFLQSVSTHVLLTDAQALMEASIRLLPGGPLFWILQTFQATSSSLSAQRHFTGNQELNVMLEPGERISLYFFRNNNLGNASVNSFRFSVTGYLVDANP